MENGQVGSSQLGCGSIEVKKKCYIKQVRNGSGQLGAGSRLGCVNLYFPHEYFFKVNNIYLPFEKSISKLLDVKCITLNSPLITKMSSAKQITIFLIILKLYKS